jgi:hypothetical protein
MARIRKFKNTWGQGGRHWPPKWMEKDFNVEEQQTQQNCIPKVSVISGGINVYRGGLKPNTPGIDVTFSVTCLKKTDILQIIQTVIVNNDDKISKEEAEKNQIWISSDGKKIGFTDPGGTLFYYTKSQLPNFVKYDGMGGGIIRLIDNPSVITENPYSKTEFHSYIVIISSNGKQQILGRINWSFTYKKADKTGMPSIITGGLTSTDLAIIKTDKKAYSELKIE